MQRAWALWLFGLSRSIAQHAARISDIGPAVATARHAPGMRTSHMPLPEPSDGRLHQLISGEVSRPWFASDAMHMLWLETRAELVEYPTFRARLLELSLAESSR